MEVVTFLRVLTRRKLLLIVGLVLAIVAGAAGAGLIPPGHPGVASSHGVALVRVLIDTEQPMVASAAAKGADSILPRALLLGDELATHDRAAAIAREAGLKPTDLSVVDPSYAFPAVPNELPLRATTAAGEAIRTPYMVALTAGADIPVLSIDAVAPTEKAAVKLADAAAAVLETSEPKSAGAA